MTPLELCSTCRWGGLFGALAALAGCSGGVSKVEAGTSTGVSAGMSASAGRGANAGNAASGAATGSGVPSGSAGQAGTTDTATRSGGSGSSASSGPLLTPGAPGASDITLAIDTSMNVRPISPYIYGTNGGDLTQEAKGLTLTRSGGNRLTAYNWETNASNAGSDYLYENDDFMSKSTVAGQAMLQAVQTSVSSAASIIMTVPIAGWVAADENGPCPSKPTPAQIAQRFFPILPKKPTAYIYPPSTTDGMVYADEFVWWLESKFPTAQTDPARRIFYMLDNEPDLWSSTHSEIHPEPLTYAELTQKNIAFATGIKAVAPKAVVFGPVNYGWEGYVSLQNAPDANGRDFISFYLAAMQAAEKTAGKRLVDVLDLHWYPEATGDGNRVTGAGVTAGEVSARLQAPRSLWDPSYSETSWITQSGSGPIELIPRMMQKINTNYPGTLLSISEYNYGGSADISGGLAQADVLGVFGAQGLFAATNWQLTSTNAYLFAGFAMYRDYDGAGATFGDTSVSLVNSDIAKASAYASIASSSGVDVTVVAINKTTAPLDAGITIRHTARLTAADVYTLTSAAASPQKGAGLTATATNAFLYSMPAMSATTLVFHP